MIGILLSSLMLQNCVTVFSDLQGARTVGKGNVELTPSFSSVSVSGDGETEKAQTHIGLQTAVGLSPTIDIRARYEYIWLAGSDGDGISAIGIGPKFSLLKDHIAVYVPIGRALGEGTSETYQLHPTFLFSLGLKKDILDLNLSPKYLISFCEDCESLFALNIGLAISSDLNAWAIRPEFGLLFKPGEEGHASQFSIGVSKVLNKK